MQTNTFLPPVPVSRRYDWLLDARDEDDTETVPVLDQGRRANLGTTPNGPSTSPVIVAEKENTAPSLRPKLAPVIIPTSQSHALLTPPASPVPHSKVSVNRHPILHKWTGSCDCTLCRKAQDGVMVVSTSTPQLRSVRSALTVSNPKTVVLRKRYSDIWSSKPSFHPSTGQEQDQDHVQDYLQPTSAASFPSDFSSNSIPTLDRHVYMAQWMRVLDDAARLAAEAEQWRLAGSALQHPLSR
ncbi:uncharacterized protein SPPG_02540 [Spizellomyces punctatus DAOM BR117]|uniref:Uncharacterized protein n=1 Tax=Spizellomyces punctatus (strain DAOM BR117) TaxID=645134 RepID=A0A0L0HLP7_SPIPD|nr:uncharacterized protein SPPG_02540 [Spizellomyces punctatus DAOM BR117]KND02037.1 hypothetical protein SPPG_02540 [Spizellomyces punctatus DAOM BR117]|eukprot:XP_016610076.1 hypothetical protein SPPG_02540 [Spizellomyces punctatus DAOM BR117]